MASSVIIADGQSQVGKVRNDNQDAIRLYDPQQDPQLQPYGALYGVADGMGGYQHGGIASTLALETLFKNFYAGSASKPLQTLRRGVEAANLAVYKTAQRMGARMGTTLSVLNIVGQNVHIAHIGDSRIYLVREGKATCVTNDHTAVGELVRLGVLSPDKARTHERRSILEKSLGMELFVQPDLLTHLLLENDYLIVCTDGVWAYVEDHEFAEIVEDAKDPPRITQALLDLALERESDDNLSTVVVHARELSPAPVVEESARSRITRLIPGRLNGRA